MLSQRELYELSKRHTDETLGPFGFRDQRYSYSSFWLEQACEFVALGFATPIACVEVVVRAKVGLPYCVDHRQTTPKTQQKSARIPSL